MSVEAEKDMQDPRSWAKRPWPIGIIGQFYEQNQELIAANKADCHHTLERGMILALRYRYKVWACHVCGKIVSSQGLGQGSKEKDKKEKEQQSIDNGLTPCELCGSAWYCSNKCCRKDWLVHGLLCTQYRLFRTSQEPAPDCYRCLGIELPVDGTTPRPIWIMYAKGLSNRPQQRHAGMVRTTFLYRDDPFYDLGMKMGGKAQVIKQPGPLWCSRICVARRQSSLLQPVNECVKHLLRKLGPKAFGSLEGFFDSDKHMQDDKLF